MNRNWKITHSISVCSSLSSDSAAKEMQIMKMTLREQMQLESN